MKQATLDELMAYVHALRRLAKDRRHNGGTVLRFEDGGAGDVFEVGVWQGPSIDLGPSLPRFYDHLVTAIRDRELELLDAVLAVAEAEALKLADDQTAEADKARNMLGVKP